MITRLRNYKSKIALILRVIFFVVFLLFLSIAIVNQFLPAKIATIFPSGSMNGTVYSGLINLFFGRFAIILWCFLAYYCVFNSILRKGNALALYQYKAYRYLKAGNDLNVLDLNDVKGFKVAEKKVNRSKMISVQGDVKYSQSKKINSYQRRKKTNDNKKFPYRRFSIVAPMVIGLVAVALHCALSVNDIMAILGNNAFNNSVINFITGNIGYILISIAVYLLMILILIIKYRKQIKEKRLKRAGKKVAKISNIANVVFVRSDGKKNFLTEDSLAVLKKNPNKSCSIIEHLDVLDEVERKYYNAIKNAVCQYKKIIYDDYNNVEILKLKRKAVLGLSLSENELYVHLADMPYGIDEAKCVRIINWRIKKLQYRIKIENRNEVNCIVKHIESKLAKVGKVKKYLPINFANAYSESSFVLSDVRGKRKVEKN